MRFIYLLLTFLGFSLGSLKSDIPDEFRPYIIFISIAFLLWSFIDAYRLNIRSYWVFPFFILFFGPACGIPFYFFISERKRMEAYSVD